MVLPKTVDDVSVTITTLADNECPFGIRGGGHGAHALSNSVEEGVTLDMGEYPLVTIILGVEQSNANQLTTTLRLVQHHDL